MESHLYAPVPVNPVLTFPTPSELMLNLNDVPDPVFVLPSDSISSHEKKRHYLECIEHYIHFLHHQFHLLGEHPPNIDRVSSYRGLSSRSIRTLLVHMEHNSRKLSDRTRHEEQRFISLRNQLQ